VSLPLAELRAAAEAWQVEITTPRHYGTEAFDALEDLLLGDGAICARCKWEGPWL
jgi:hypothetical protein